MRSIVWIAMMLMGIVCGASSSMGADGQAADAVSAEGLNGAIEGTVKEVADKGSYVVVTVAKVPTGQKDFSALVGRDLKVHARMINPREFDAASQEFVRSLKAGQAASLKVFWDRGGKRVRLSPDQEQTPAAAAEAASPRPAAPAASAVVTFPNQVQIGNVFTVGEKVEVEAAVATGASVAWTVADYRGARVDAGTAAVADHRVRIAPKIAAPGFYSAQFTAESSGGEAIGAPAITTVAIVPPADIAKMPDSPFAMVTHFYKSMPYEVMPLVSKAGITSVRDEIEWNSFEKTRGNFALTGAAQAYLPALARHHLEPLLVLAFGNKNYIPGVPEFAAAPANAEQYEAYTRYALKAIEQFQQPLLAVEIWNEYNGSFCRGSAAEDRPRYYTEMLAHSYQAIKAANPQIKVVGGAMVKIPLPYAEKLFKQGALKYMDAIAVHPYRATPEGVEKELTALSEMMKRYNDGTAKPIWVTETGSWRDPTSERAMTAQYLVRMITLMRSCPDVERIYWYLLCDFREFKTMGLLHGADDPSGRFTPTMVYPAYANLIHRLYSSNFGGRENTDARTRIYRFDAADYSTWVCWSTAETAQVVVNGAGPVMRVNLVGGEERLSPTGDGTLLIEVGAEPFYLVASRGAVTSLRDLPWADRILADSVEDFSGTQGQRGWSYHYVLSDGAGYDPDALKPMEWSVSKGDWDDIWRGPAAYPSIGEASMNPSAGQGKQAWAVRRWTSTFDGPARVALSVSRTNAKGDGVGFKVFLDGRELASYEVKPKDQQKHSLDVTLKRGSRLDFVITQGPGTNHEFDTTGLRALILTGSLSDAVLE